MGATAADRVRVSAAPHLTAVARQLQGDAALEQVLLLLCEQLGTTRAVLGTVEDGVHTVDLAVQVGVGRTPELEVARPAEESWCARVPADGPLVVPDVRQRPDLAPLPVTEALGLRCYVGTPVHGADGEPLAVLGVASEQPLPPLTDRDLAVLDGLAGVVGELYGALGRSRRPARREPGLAAVADALSRADGLESLARPLLAQLHDLSGLSSTYLTAVHEDGGEQEILYAQNVKEGFALPEGLHVPWADTLCKRSLDEGRQCTTDVPAVWGDSQAAADLGIVTYVSVPVRLSDGRVWGTLCGADDVRHEDAADHLTTLNLFATLLAAEVERAAARVLRTDPLTGAAHGDAVLPFLEQALADRRRDQTVAVVHLDVDGLDGVARSLGGAVADALLVEVAARVRATAGAEALVARPGGSSLLVAARVVTGREEELLARARRAGRFSHAASGVEVRSAAGLAATQGLLDAPALLAQAAEQMRRDQPLG